jgi:hypothetical protein
MVTSMKLRLATTVAAPSIAAVTYAGAFNPTSAGEIVGDGYRIDGGFGPNEFVHRSLSRGDGVFGSSKREGSPMNFLCKLLIWSFLCCLLATRVQAQETERGDGI